MKLEEIFKESKDDEFEEIEGTYAGVKFSDGTSTSLEKYTKNNNILNPCDAKSYHTTLLYSRKPLPNYEPMGDYETPMVGKVTGIESWETQPDGDGKTSNCLVVVYKCPELHKRHKDLMKEHEATYDFDEYKPHVTLSYDAGDVDPKTLPKFTEELEIVSEYMEPLKKRK